MDKSHVMEMGKSGRQAVGTYKMGNEVLLKKVITEKDLEVIIQEKQSIRESYR